MNRLKTANRNPDAAPNGSEGRRSNPRWLYLFFAMVAISATAASITYLGDRRTERDLEQVQDFTSRWNSWRSIEDSIRASLDDIGLQVRPQFSILQQHQPSLEFRHTIERMRRCMRSLQTFATPPMAPSEALRINTALSILSAATDSLEAAARGFGEVNAQLPTTLISALHQSWEYRYAGLVHALNSVRAARMSIVTRLTNASNSRSAAWRSFAEIANTVALVAILLLTLAGVVMARRLSAAERERSEQFAKLQESEDRFRKVVANVPGAIFRTRITEDWPFEFLSDNIEQITGYPASDFIENRVRRFASIIHPADIGRVDAIVAAAIEQGTPYAVEYRIIDANAEVVWLSERGQIVPSPDGKACWIDGALFDVTGRKKAADDLAKSEETLRALIDASPSVAMLLDADGRIIAANEVLARSVGLRRDQVLGMLGYEIFPQEPVRPVWEYFRKVIDTGEKCDFEQFHEGKFTHVYLRPICDARGRVVRVAAFGQDITAWKQALNESDRFKYLLDQTSDIVGIVTPQMDFVYVNRAHREFANEFGPLAGMKLDMKRVVTRDSLAIMMETAFPTAKREGAWQGDITLVNAAGSEIPASIVLVAHRSDSNELEFLSCIIRDMTSHKQAEQQLAETNNRLHEMLNAIPLPVFYKDLNLRYLGCNSAFERFLGIKEADIIGKSAYDLRSESEARKVSESDLELLTTRTEHVEEFVTPNANGDIRTVLLHKAPITNIDGTSAGLVAVVIDITERKQMEMAIAQSERQLREMTSGMPGLVYQFKVDPDGTIRLPYVSDGAEMLFGINPAELMQNGSQIFDYIYPDDLQMLRDSVARVVSEQTDWQLEFRCLINGKTIWVNGSSRLKRQLDGSVVWNGMLVDITAQKSAEAQLRKSESRFSAIFDAAGFGMTSTDVNGRILECNPAFQRMLLYTSDELRNMTIADITHPEDLPREHRRLRDIATCSAPTFSQYEKRYVRKDGTTIWVRLSVIEFRNEAGQPDHYISLVEDTTQRVLAKARLHESESHYRSLFEGSSDGLFLMTDTFLDCNAHAAEIWGCSREDIVGKTPADFSPEFQPDGRRSQDAALEYVRAAQAGTVQSFNWRHIRTDGTEIDTEISLKLLSGPDNKILLASMRDISDRIRIEAALRESLLQLNTLVESAVDGIILVDGTGLIESVNPAAKKTFAANSEQLVGNNIVNMLAEPHRSQYLELMRHPDSEYEAGLLRGIHEVLGIRTDDVVFPMDFALSPLRLGNHLKYVAVVRDITSRRTTEQRIVENEARLEAILRSAGDGIIVIDNDGLVHIFNEAAQAIFERPATAMIGRPVDEIIPGLNGTSLPVLGERMSFETVGNNEKRGVFPVQLSISRVSVGGTDSYAIIARDLTEDYNRRERMMEADKLTSIGTLAAGIAHEFKNYLAGIIGNASFALDGLKEPNGIEGARDAFEQIIAIGEKANEIALSLLTYSRRRQDDLEPLDLRDLIISTLRFTGKELADKNIEVITNFEEAPKVMVSANRTQQVLLNLIINASQAIVEGGVISVSLQYQDGMVVLKIADSGLGISQENIRRIFDPFFSTKGVWGKDAVHGTGLGLSICKNIINSFGGEITVESVVGSGTTFTITLPIPVSDVHAQQPARQTEQLL